jgi:ATP-dependent DNA ligase
MALPIEPPIEPMLAKATDALPEGDAWLFEPKWDGFRAIVFKDGGEVRIQSRDLKPFERYFPELVPPLQRLLPDRCIIDGEIVIATGDGLDFEAMLLRIHPAASRIALLAKETPASLVVFDMLALGDEDLRERPMNERREKLVAALGVGTPPIYVTPLTTDRPTAQDWFQRFEGAGLDGVIAKAKDGVYEPGKRGWIKVKHQRTADCVVAGFRWHKGGKGERIGSLLLGLFDDRGQLQHVGVTSAFTAERRRALVEELAPLRVNAKEGHPWGDWADWTEEQAQHGARRPGATSRWNRGKDLSWEPLRPERVCEVAYDHLQGSRFRHAAFFVRWRPDKRPEDCTYASLEVVPAYELMKIFKPSTPAE